MSGRALALVALVALAGCGGRVAEVPDAGGGADAGDDSGTGTSPGTGTPPDVVAPAQEDVTEVLTGAGRLFWATEQSGAHGCDPDDCAGTKVDYPTLDPAYPRAASLAIDDAFLYWVTDIPAALVRCPIGGCATAQTILPPASVTISSLAVDATDVYFTAYVDDAVLRCPKTGCVGEPTPVATSEAGPRSLALDADHVYWIDDASGRVRRVAKATPGAEPETIAEGEDQPSALQILGGLAYWTTGTAIDVCPVGGCDGPPLGLVTGLSSPRALASDETHFYWLDGLGATDEGRLARCPIAGCGATGPEALVEGARSSTAEHAVALDATRVFFAGLTSNHGRADGFVASIAK